MALLPVAEALHRVLARAAPLGAEEVPLDQAAGRVLATDLAARRSQPPADVSAMDGYAVRFDDLGTIPARLTVVGEVAAGKPFLRRLRPGEAARIFTGGVVPDGADTVVIQENTRREGDRVVIGQAARKAQNVRGAGLDFRAGDILLRQGRRLTPVEVGLAASMNHAAVPVHRRPKVALLATGDELVMPGVEPGPGQIILSNGFALGALYRAEGADVIDLGVVGDRLEPTTAAIRRARDAGADVLVSTGGASVGEYDLMQQALKQEGLDLAFWKIAMRPGKPLMSGMLGQTHVLGLPGNPVSSVVCSVLFVLPLLRRLSGRVDLTARVESAALGRDVPANDEREDYLRAALADNGGEIPVATPFPVQDSSMMALLAKSDCLIIRAPYAQAAAAGTSVPIVRLRF
jgi:molybdopterin molybdotransferase